MATCVVPGDRESDWTGQTRRAAYTEPLSPSAISCRSAKYSWGSTSIMNSERGEIASAIHSGKRCNWDWERAFGGKSVNPSSLSLSLSRPPTPNVSVVDVRSAVSGANLLSRSGEGGTCNLGVTRGALSVVEPVSLLKCELWGEPCTRREVARKRVG